MGKKKSGQQTIKTATTFPIHKNKTLSANLNSYIKLLKAKHSQISTKEYLSLIHNYIARFVKIKGNLPNKVVIRTTSKIKICRGCDKWAIGSRKMLECSLCEDFYHLECAQELENGERWVCKICDEINKKKFSAIEELEKYDKLKSCEKCTKNKKEVSVRCLRCQKHYHKSCYGKTDVVCSQCSEDIADRIQKVKSPNKQLTIRESFCRAQKRLSNSSELSRTVSQKKQQTLTMTIKDVGKEISQSTQSSTIISNSRRFTSQFPEMTDEEISSYKKSLLFAILAKNMEYSEELQPRNCDLFESNEESLDFAIEHISYSDYRMFLKYKLQPIGPFLLEYKQKMGYDVVADKNLKKGMIICEYVGDVVTHRVALMGKSNDSIMQLKIGKNADETLFIVPEKFTNIARFINGINNEKDKNKANVETVRGLAKGRPVVILYTSREIKKGQSLLYDYNAGGAAVGYDTSEYE